MVFSPNLCTHILVLDFIWALVLHMLLLTYSVHFFNWCPSQGMLHFMLQAQVLQLVDLLSRSTWHSSTFGDLQVDSKLYWVLGNSFRYCIVDKGKARSVPTYSSLLFFRVFVDVCTWFSCVLRSCGLNDQVLYINFGPTYVVLYRYILGELVTIVIFICTVRTGCRWVLSGL